MKLETTIPARNDGTLRIEGVNGQRYVFMTDASGSLVADIDHDPTVAHLLSLGTFMPSDEKDHERAAALLAKALPAADGDGEDPDDDEGDENAAPQENENGLQTEAEQIPAPAKTRKVKAAAAAE